MVIEIDGMGSAPQVVLSLLSRSRPWIFSRFQDVATAAQFLPFWTRLASTPLPGKWEPTFSTSPEMRFIQ